MKQNLINKLSSTYLRGPFVLTQLRVKTTGNASLMHQYLKDFPARATTVSLVDIVRWVHGYKDEEQSAFTFLFVITIAAKYLWCFNHFFG